MQKQNEVITLSDAEHRANLEKLKLEIFLVKAKSFEIPDDVLIEDPAPYFRRFEKRKRK